MSSNDQGHLFSLGFGANSEEFRRLGHQMVDVVSDYLSGQPNRPVFQPMTPAERTNLLELPLPEEGLAPEAALEFAAQRLLTHPMGNGHPRFFGWVNSPPAPIAVLLEMLGAAVNPSCAGGDHAAIYLERAVVRWLMELLGFPTGESIGLLVSGGSAATLTALAAARHRAAQRAGWNVRARGLQKISSPLVLYMSGEGHSCVRKSAELLGLGSDAVHVVAADKDLRMDVDSLRSAILQDRAAGLLPFCVVASAGTVATGAIDPLHRLADLCAEQQLWFHVDGAYGAAGVLDDRLAARYAGMERADSLALDPHKWLSVPVECGCVLVRDASLLRETFSLVPEYLRTEEGKGFGGLPWYSEYGFQQTRGYRALKLWGTLVERGRSGLAATIRRHNDLARYLAAQIHGVQEFELCAPVELSIVCFRYVPESLRGDEGRLNDLNKRMMETVQSRGKAFITNAVLNGRFALRACILHYATTQEDLDALLRIVQETGRECAGSV